MINFKKSTGKIGKIKRDYGINFCNLIQFSILNSIYISVIAKLSPSF